MPVSRNELVKQLLNQQILGESLVDSEVSRRKVWNDLSSFVEENLNEVHHKLDKVEAEIWGKLIVMEKNIRVAKAYLRASTITVDGSKSYFDGSRLGLSYFSNSRREPETETELRTLGKGVTVQLDRMGNVWMKNQTARTVCVQCAQYPEPIYLDDSYKKIMDMRFFRDSILHKLELNSSLDAPKLFKKVIIFVKLSDPSPDLNPLDCSLWFALIHLVSVDLIHLILSGQTPIPSAELSPQSSASSNCSEMDRRLHRDRESNEDSSASTSSYNPDSYRQNGSRTSTGVARKIFNQQQQQNPRRYNTNKSTIQRRSASRERTIQRKPPLNEYSIPFSNTLEQMKTERGRSPITSTTQQPKKEEFM
uniref:MH2 domain-containing protein n=1 Tax=Bursaphelenchus xylophilus TaxID=6326 RepID=A0A1I7SGU2_BURXY